MANPVFLSEQAIDDRIADVKTYVVTEAANGGTSVKVNGETVTAFADLYAKCRTGRAVLYGQATTSATGYAFYNAASVTENLIQFQVSGLLYAPNDEDYGMYVRRVRITKSGATGFSIAVSDLEGPFATNDYVDTEIIEKGTAPDAHLEAPTDERLKLILADNSVAYDSAKAIPYKLSSEIGDRMIVVMTLTAASTDITLPSIAANDTTVKDFIIEAKNEYAVDGVATDAGINIPRTDFKLVCRDGESLSDVTTVKAGKTALICFTQKSPVVVDGTTYPCWFVQNVPEGDPS